MYLICVIPHASLYVFSIRYPLKGSKPFKGLHICIVYILWVTVRSKINLIQLLRFARRSAFIPNDRDETKKVKTLSISLR